MKNNVTPSEKAHTTGRWAEIIFRALSSRVAKRWKFVSFRGAGSGEWRGVVDLVAIRKDTKQPHVPGLKRGDLFELVLIQVKGGSAKAPTQEDIQRLRQVATHYGAKAVVLFTWKKGTAAEFAVLEEDGTWTPSSGAKVFG